MKTRIYSAISCFPAICCAAWLCLLVSASGQPVLVSTNFEGLTFSFGLDKTQFNAGEGIRAMITASNNLDAERTIRYAAGGRDTPLGDVIITDATTGAQILNPIPLEYRMGYALRGLDLSPHEEMAFDCELVQRYGLTNPGTYFIHAKGRLPPSNCPVGINCPRVPVDTPAIAITILESTNKAAESPHPTLQNNALSVDKRPFGAPTTPAENPTDNRTTAIESSQPARSEALNESKPWLWLLGICGSLLAVVLVRAQLRSR